MAKLKDATRVFYQGAGEEEIDGFNKLMAHVTRAGQYAENPPTGQRLIGAAATTGAIVNPAAAAKVAAVAAAAKFLFTTEAGKKYLLASSTLEPGSSAMADLAGRVFRMVPAAAARAATQRDQ